MGIFLGPYPTRHPIKEKSRTTGRSQECRQCNSNYSNPALSQQISSSKNAMSSSWIDSRLMILINNNPTLRDHPPSSHSSMKIRGSHDLRGQHPQRTTPIANEQRRWPRDTRHEPDHTVQAHHPDPHRLVSNQATLPQQGFLSRRPHDSSVCRILTDHEYVHCSHRRPLRYPDPHASLTSLAIRRLPMTR